MLFCPKRHQIKYNNLTREALLSLRTERSKQMSEKSQKHQFKQSRESDQWFKQAALNRKPHLHLSLNPAAKLTSLKPRVQNARPSLICKQNKRVLSQQRFLQEKQHEKQKMTKKLLLSKSTTTASWLLLVRHPITKDLDPAQIRNWRLFSRSSRRRSIASQTTRTTSCSMKSRERCEAWWLLWRTQLSRKIVICSTRRARKSSKMSLAFFLSRSREPVPCRVRVSFKLSTQWWFRIRLKEDR